MKKLFLLILPILILSGCSLQNKNISGIANIGIEQKLNDVISQLTALQNKNISLETILSEQLQKIQTLLEENEQLKQEIEKYKQLLQQSL